VGLSGCRGEGQILKNPPYKFDESFGFVNFKNFSVGTSIALFRVCFYRIIDLIDHGAVSDSQSFVQDER
jgi:hypothetical protein